MEKIEKIEKIKEYNFKAGPGYCGINFERILNENPNSNFIRVSWYDEDDDEIIIYVVTPRGVTRCKNVGLSQYLDEIKIIVNHDGSVSGRNRSARESPGQLIYVLNFCDINREFSTSVFDVYPTKDEDFIKFFEKLRKREYNREIISVVAM